VGSTKISVSKEKNSNVRLLLLPSWITIYKEKLNFVKSQQI
jgi:hypothetical protein